MSLLDRVKPSPASPASPQGAPPRPAAPQQSVALAPSPTAQPPAAAAGEKPSAVALLQLVSTGDLKNLTVAQRLSYYEATCTALGLNPLTKPFDFVVLNNKLVMYANKEASAQLACRDTVSVEVKQFNMVPEANIIECWVRASSPDGRVTDEIGCVACAPAVKGADAANARMKAVTKAKRRAVLSHCGLGMLDESEIETIAGARPVAVDFDQKTLEARDGKSPAPVVDASSVEPLDVASAFAAAPEQSVDSRREASTQPKGRKPRQAPEPAEPGDAFEPAVGDAAQPRGELAAGSDLAPAGNPALDLGPEQPFTWEDKDCRQRLLREIRTRFPRISRENLVKIADGYKAATAWPVVIRNLDDILAFEKSKGNSELL